MDEIHDCELSLTVLKDISKQLFASESTDDNMRKIKAITAQIAKHERIAEAKKIAETKPVVLN